VTDLSLDVVVSRLDDLREDVRDLRTDLAEQRTGQVSRGEWTQRNTLVDGRFDSHGREIGQLRADLAAVRSDTAPKRAPWWAVLAVVVAAGGVLVDLVGRLIAS
jgi:hypothetical protein